MQFGPLPRKLSGVRNGDVTPESEFFASKCMELLYVNLGYATLTTGDLHAHVASVPVTATNDNGHLMHQDGALHNDICDTIRAYVVEELHPSATRHNIRQRKHLDDLTGLFNQLLQKDNMRTSDMLPAEVMPMLQLALCDASLFYFSTNLFSSPERAR